MSRGVVLWPDQTTSSTVRAIWRELSNAGLPSLATFTHARHQPHCSLIVGETLETDATLHQIGSVPAEPTPLLAESAIVFPGGVLALGCVMNEQLLREQRRVHDAAEAFVTDRWRYFIPERWTPHITLSVGLAPDQLGTAIRIVIPHLPLQGTFERGGVEDGTTGENWPTPTAASSDRFY